MIIHLNNTNTSTLWIKLMDYQQCKRNSFFWTQMASGLVWQLG